MNFTDYGGKRVAVTGCSSGIGGGLAQALVTLGAEVIGMSRRAPEVPLTSFIPLDLTSEGSVEAAAARVEGHIDALFNCAGGPATVPPADLIKVNFLGPRLLTERLLGSMGTAGAIASVSSSSGSDWREHLPTVREFLAMPTFEAGATWYAAHQRTAGHAYPFSKQAMVVWTMMQSVPLAARGLRMNTTSPGAVQTPLLEATEEIFGAEALGAVEHPSGRRSQVAGRRAGRAPRSSSTAHLPHTSRAPTSPSTAATPHGWRFRRAADASAERIRALR